MSHYLEGVVAGFGIAFVASNTFGFLRDYYRSKRNIIKEQADYARRARDRSEKYCIGDFKSRSPESGWGGKLALRRFNEGKFNRAIEERAKSASLQ